MLNGKCVQEVGVVVQQVKTYLGRLYPLLECQGLCLASTSDAASCSHCLWEATGDGAGTQVPEAPVRSLDSCLQPDPATIAWAFRK